LTESAHRNVFADLGDQRAALLSSKLPAPFDDASNASRVPGEFASAVLASFPRECLELNRCGRRNRFHN